MKVELIACTPNPDDVCAIGAGTCVNREVPVTGNLRALRGALASGHESVAEHASFTFAISGVSRALTHQLVRHRIGVAFSQQSQRYVNMGQFEYVTPSTMKYGEVQFKRRTSDGRVVDASEDFKYEFDEFMRYAQSLYEDMISAGIPEEDARYVLPNACCTNIVVTMNARELRHFFNLRCCARSQWEIRELADKMLALCKEVAPTIFENAGPSCVATGRCPESRSCGRLSLHNTK